MTRISVKLLVAILSLLRILPIRWVLPLGRFLGSRTIMFFSREKKIAHTQIQFALGDSVDPPAVIRSLGAHLGESIVELIFVDKILNGQGDFEETADVQKLTEKGAVVLTGHLGNFELLGAYYTFHDYKLFTVGRKLRSAFQQQLLEEFRNSYGLRTLWRDDRPSNKMMVQLLKTEHAISALVDQDAATESEYSPFFGLPARTIAMPVKIAIKYDLRLFTVFFVRTDTLRYKIIVEDLPFDRESETAVTEALGIYHERLEKVIRAYPEQWIWWHKRWRRRPGAEEHPMPTDDYLTWLKSVND